MPASVFFLSLIIVLIGLGVFRFIQGRHRDAAWKEIAETYGLSYLQPGFLQASAVRGELDGADMVLETFKRGSGNNKRTFTRLRIQGRGGIDRQLSLKREGVLTKVGKKIVGEDVLVHDRIFDDAVHIKGNELTIAAMMNAESRRAIKRAVVEYGAVVREGEVYWEKSGVATDVDYLHHLVNGMRRVFTACSVPVSSIPERLKDNALEDPHPQVRRHNLDMLTRRFPIDSYPSVGDACRGALTDKHPDVRFTAARFLGEEGFSALGVIAQDRRVSDARRAEALSAIIYQVPRPRAVELLRSMARERGAELLGAIALAAGHLKVTEVVEPLLEQLELNRQRGTELVSALVKGLGYIGDARCEDAFISLLEGDEEDAAVLIAVADGLALFGSLRSVAPLMPLTKGLRRGNDVKKAARGAIEAIQSRSTHAGAGQLSIIDVRQRGGLSFVEDEA